MVLWAVWLMRARVAKALEDLAKAIREESPEDWEVVGGSATASVNYQTEETKVVEEPEEAKQLPIFPRDPAGEATGSSVSYRPGIRCYVVLSNPHQPNSVGFWRGPAPETWLEIERNLKGGALKGSGARLRRVQDQDEAEKIWRQTFPCREMPLVHLK